MIVKTVYENKPVHQKLAVFFSFLRPYFEYFSLLFRLKFSDI